MPHSNHAPSPQTASSSFDHVTSPLANHPTSCRTCELTLSRLVTLTHHERFDTPGAIVIHMSLTVHISCLHAPTRTPQSIDIFSERPPVCTACSQTKLTTICAHTACPTRALTIQYTTPHISCALPALHIHPCQHAAFRPHAAFPRAPTNQFLDLNQTVLHAPSALSSRGIAQCSCQHTVPHAVGHPRTPTHQPIP